MAERLDDPLADRLRLAHHGLRVDRLVGGDQDEPLDLELRGELRDDLRGDDVVANRRKWMRVHQRDVLVRRCVEHDRRPVLLEHLAPHRLRVLHVDQLGNRCGEVALVDELALDLEERRLGVVDEDQAGRADTRDLPAELGADRPAGAGDEHGVPLEIRRDALEVDLDLLAPEHVLDLHRPDLPCEVQIAGDQLVEARQRLHGDVRRLSRLDDEPARLAGRGRDRDQHLVRLELADEPREVGHRAEHPHAVDARVALARIVVDEADRRVREHPRAVHLLDDQPAGIPRSDDDHLFPARDDTEAEARPFHERARREPHPGHEREGDEQVHHGDRARQPDAVDRRDEVHGHVRKERRDDDAARRAPHVAHRHVPPPAAMEAEHEEDRELDRDDEQDRAAKQCVVVDRQALVEPELEREHPGDGDDRRVRQQLQQPVAADSGHAAAAPARTTERTTSTTRSCASAGMPGQSGTEKFTFATASVSGSEPAS